MLLSQRFKFIVEKICIDATLVVLVQDEKIARFDLGNEANLK